MTEVEVELKVPIKRMPWVRVQMNIIKQLLKKWVTSYADIYCTY